MGASQAKTHKVIKQTSPFGSSKILSEVAQNLRYEMRGIQKAYWVQTCQPCSNQLNILKLPKLHRPAHTHTCPPKLPDQPSLVTLFVNLIQSGLPPKPAKTSLPAQISTNPPDLPRRLKMLRTAQPAALQPHFLPEKHIHFWIVALKLFLATSRACLSST